MGDHRFVMYMLSMNVSKYLTKRALTITQDSAVSSAALRCKTPKLAFAQDRSVLPSNVYIPLYFSMGSSSETTLGRWYYLIR